MAIYALGDLVPDVHPDAWVHEGAHVIGRVTIGAGSSVWPSAVIRGDTNAIRIGARTSIQDGAVIHCTPEFETVIGDDCVVGHLCHIEGATVEDGCTVGTGSIVLHDARVRTGSLVGAGAVVPGGMEVPTGAMALGVPAKLREGALGPDPFLAQAAHYVENGRRFRADLRRID